VIVGRCHSRNHGLFSIHSPLVQLADFPNAVVHGSRVSELSEIEALLRGSGDLRAESRAKS
jgi:hypothetical protein